jgi:uncharacterized protein (TIGR02996 family)
MEEAFLARLRQRPDDEDNRAVYADWLEEQGRAVEAAFLRQQAALKKLSSGDTKFGAASSELRKMAHKVDPKWRRLVAYAPIESCATRFDFVCPKQWSALEATALGDEVRYCNSCKQNVHYTTTVEEAQRHAKEGHCVVVDIAQLRRPNDLSVFPWGSAMLPMGQPLPPEPPPVLLPTPKPAPPPPAPTLVQRIKALFS